MNRKLLAFTLIELLVVIAIIGILSGLIIVTMNGVTQKANIAKAQVFSNSLRNALMMNIVGEWKFDEGSGTGANDTWSNVNNGTLYGFADTTSGYGDSHNSGWMSYSGCVYGTCLQFDGLDDYVSVANANLQNFTSKTVIIWIKAPVSSLGYVGGYVFNNGYWTSPYGDIIYGYPNDNKLTIYLKNTAATAVSWYKIIALNENEWTQIGYTWDGTNAWYIKNGEKLGKLAFSGTLGCSGSNLFFGKYDAYFKGMMDDIRVFNAAVPASQIKEQYYAGLNNLLISGNISIEEYLNRINQIAYGK